MFCNRFNLLDVERCIYGMDKVAAKRVNAKSALKRDKYVSSGNQTFLYILTVRNTESLGISSSWHVPNLTLCDKSRTVTFKAKQHFPFYRRS